MPDVRHLIAECPPRKDAPGAPCGVYYAERATPCAPRFPAWRPLQLQLPHLRQLRDVAAGFVIRESPPETLFGSHYL
jgi:hypothetical protein